MRKLDPLKIPENLNQDRSDELIQEIRHFAKQRAKEYCWLLPELYRVLDDFDAALGVRYKPPTKADGYKDGYEAANSAFWEELWSKLTPEAKAKLQATTNYGIDDQETVRCEPKDKVMAVFALLTVYKPVAQLIARTWCRSSRLQPRDSTTDRVPIKWWANSGKF